MHTCESQTTFLDQWQLNFVSFHIKLSMNLISHYSKNEMWKESASNLFQIIIITNIFRSIYACDTSGPGNNELGPYRFIFCVKVTGSHIP